MALTNSATGFGSVAKAFHWAVVLLFLNQYVVATVMIMMNKDDTVFGLGQGWYYTWHKSVGLLILAIVLLRLTWRITTRLPDWAESLQDWERTTVSWIERLLYVCMFVMPLSGYLFTEAGGYYFKWFGVVTLPVLIAKTPVLAVVAEVTHVITSYLILILVTLHVALGVKHQVVDKDGFLYRMLPFGRRS